jgi:transposase
MSDLNVHSADNRFSAGSIMITWLDSSDVYLHRDPVDFRKAINGLSTIVSDSMEMSPFDNAIFIFCNKRRTQLKVLYWDDTGFALWQKRLEKQTFKWPKRSDQNTLKLSHEQWEWLLRGFDFTKIKPHKRMKFSAVG